MSRLCLSHSSCICACIVRLQLGLRDPDGALTDAISETRRLARGVVVEGDGEGLALGSPGAAGDYGEGDGEGEGGYGDDDEDYADDQ